MSSNIGVKYKAPTSHYEALEREHFGCPDAGTGIYARWGAAQTVRDKTKVFLAGLANDLRNRQDIRLEAARMMNEVEKLPLVVGELRACLQAINDEFVDPLEPWGPDLELPRDWLLRVRETLKKTSDMKDVLSISDYEEVLADHNRLVRELDVALNGEDGAAKQASLCDIVLQVRMQQDL